MQMKIFMLKSAWDLSMNPPFAVKSKMESSSNGTNVIANKQKFNPRLRRVTKPKIILSLLENFI